MKITPPLPLHWLGSIDIVKFNSLLLWKKEWWIFNESLTDLDMTVMSCKNNVTFMVNQHRSVHRARRCRGVEDPRPGPGRSEFLAAGTMHWKEGQVYPQDLQSPCSVVISFLATQNKAIPEFDAVIDGPTTSSKGWLGVMKWPTLRTSGTWQPGCD